MEPNSPFGRESQPADVDITMGQPGARRGAPPVGVPTPPNGNQDGSGKSGTVDVFFGRPGPRGTTHTPNTAQLDTLKASLKPEVDRVLDELRRMGEPGRLAAKRIKQVWDDIRSYTPSAAYATISPVESAEGIERSYFARAHWLTFIRNALILLPLLLTWIALGLASWAYQQELANSPLDVNHPLLELWQRGFTLQGSANAFSLSSFSAVAFGDAGLFFLLIIVGVWADGLAMRARSVALSAQRSLEDITMKICHYCAELRINESGFPDMQAWSEEIRRTINEAAAATQNASDSLRNMSNLANQFQSNVNTLSASAQTVAGSAGALTGAVSGVSQSAAAMKDAAKLAADEGKRSADALNIVLARMNEFAKSSAGSAAEVRAMSAEIITGFKQANEAMRDAAATMQNAAERLGGTLPERDDDDDRGRGPFGWLFGGGKRRRNTRRPGAGYQRAPGAAALTPPYGDDSYPLRAPQPARRSYGPAATPPSPAPRYPSPPVAFRPTPPATPPATPYTPPSYTPPPTHEASNPPIYLPGRDEPQDGGDSFRRS